MIIFLFAVIQSTCILTAKNIFLLKTLKLPVSKMNDLNCKWQGLGLTIGAAFMDVKKATTLASIVVMAFMLAGGFFVQVIWPI